MSRALELNEAASPARSIDVIVGILTQGASDVLIGRRPPGKHMAGAWEFPGGKLEPGEAPYSGLKRELAEELGIRVTAAEPLIEQHFTYPDRSVRLDVWWVISYEGKAQPREGQELSWVAAESLAEIDLLPADVPIVAAVRERIGRS